MLPSVPFIGLPKKRWKDGMEKKERLGVYDDLSDDEEDDDFLDDEDLSADGSSVQQSQLGNQYASSRRAQSVAEGADGGGGYADQDEYYEEEDYEEGDRRVSNAWEGRKSSVYDDNDDGIYDDDDGDADMDWFDPKEAKRGAMLDFCCGSCLDFRRRLRDRRMHYIIREYEDRVREYDRKMRRKIREEMREHEKAVLREAYEAMKRRKANNFHRRNKTAVSEDLQRRLDERERETARMNYHFSNLPDWAVEKRDEREAQRVENIREQERDAKRAAEKKRLDDRKKMMEHELQVMGEDNRVTQEVLSIMRRAGLKEGVNLADHGIVPVMIPMKDAQERTELRLRKDVDFSKMKKKKKKAKRGAGAAAASPKRIEKKEGDGENGIKGDKDRTGTANGDDDDDDDDEKRFRPFNIDLSHSSKVVDLLCYEIGERGALCLAAELIRGACPNIETLSLTNCEIKTRGLGRLLHGIRVGNLVRLNYLNLRGNHLGPRALDYIRETMKAGVFDSLATIDLRDNELGDDGATAVVRLIIAGTLKNISVLYLQRNGITDVGFSRIVKALQTLQPLKCPKLVNIALEENPISARIKREFSPIPSYLSL